MAGFKRQVTSDRDLQLIQDNVANALAPLQAQPMVGGNVVTSVSLTTSTTAVPHGLNHTPQYFSILDLTANATVSRAQASDSRFIYLKASASCTATVWVN